MNWHVIIRPAVSQTIGSGGLSRAGVVRLLARLHNELPARADRLRRRRDANDPDFFSWRVMLFDGGALHLCDFKIDDVTAQGYLFVESLMHST